MLGQILGLGACIGAVLAGAAWSLVLAGVVLSTTMWLRGLPRALGLLALPFVLSASAPLHSVYGLDAGIWSAIVAASAIPLWLATGGAVPWRGPALLAILFGAAFTVLWVAPWAASLVSSDIAARAQVMLIAMLTFGGIHVWRLRYLR